MKTPWVNIVNGRKPEGLNFLRLDEQSDKTLR